MLEKQLDIQDNKERSNQFKIWQKIYFY